MQTNGLGLCKKDHTNGRLQITKGRLGGVLRYEQWGFEISANNHIVAESVTNVAYKAAASPG